MDDSISRHAAIELIERMKPYHQDADDIAEMIANMPSAQPEVIRCKDCKWCEDADGLMCKNTASWVVATENDFGCILAERRTDG